MSMCAKGALNMNAEAGFGSHVRGRREALGLTRKQLAHRVGCSIETVRKIETGVRHPSRQMADLLAQVLSLDRQTMSAQPTNLPAPLTSFIDRTSELAAVRARLTQPDVRLVTLVGPPGIGKTRLGIQAGQAVLDQFADGAWFIPLAPISDPALVLPAIARTFDIADAGATPLMTRLQDHLRPKRLLLVLDNFEHILDAAPVVTDLLKACSKVKVLATSREPLHAYGEHEYPMPALSLPPRGQTLPVEQLAEFDAIKLFVTRAQAFQPGFELSAGNAQAVADICVRLDGLPLAIELAASRLRQFTLVKLRDVLNDAPLRALVGAARDVEPRQRTLRTAIQWSYDLLSPAEHTAFNRLGVFAGGCTTEAALAVCELADDSLLHALADRSLLKCDTDERWTMLEMIREFALDALAQSSGDALEQAGQRHAEYFARILKPDSDEAYNVIEVEQHNAGAALRWLLDHKHPLTFELTQFMGWYFHLAGLLSENRRMLHEVLSAGIEMTPLIHYDLLSGSTIVASLQHDFKEALRYSDETLGIARTMNSQPLISGGLLDHAMVYIEMDDYAQVKKASLESLRIGRSIQEPEHIVGALINLGRAALDEEDVSQAAICYEEAYALCQAPDWRQHIYASYVCKGMGEIALSRRDYDRALSLLREGLEHSKPASIKSLMLGALAGIIGTKVAVRGAMPHRTTDDVQRAAKIWGAAEALSEKMGLLDSPDDRRRIDALIAEARTRIAPETFDAAWAEGRELSLDEAIALAMTD
jgi:predicted ATPase/DNA-binding XRE family transcriptional regulator